MVKFDLTNCKNLGDLGNVWDSLESEDDFKRFFLQYWGFLEETISKEKGIRPGDIRPFGETFSRINSNIHFLRDRGSKMRSDFALKVYWFLSVPQDLSEAIRCEKKLE